MKTIGIVVVLFLFALLFRHAYIIGREHLNKKWRRQMKDGEQCYFIEGFGNDERIDCKIKAVSYNSAYVLVVYENDLGEQEETMWSKNQLFKY